MTKQTYKKIESEFGAVATAIRTFNNAIKQASGLSAIAEAARDAYDQHTDAWQESESGQESLQQTERLETIAEAVEEATGQLNAAMDAWHELQQNAPQGAFN